MAKIGFIGVGNMGGPMTCNLIKAGHDVTVFDLSQENLDLVAAEGAIIASSAGSAVKGADIIVTMLPNGKHVTEVYFKGVFDAASKGALMIDCSTIDVNTSRTIYEQAISKGFLMLDAPVSGGVGGATKGTLTFMVGGTDEAFETARKILRSMGENIIHCGDAGTGQAAKICNNMMLGIQMASVAEAFVLAERLGLGALRLFDVANTSSGQCWSLSSYCPVPGPVETSPANREYEPGFATTLMLKDMKLALDAAKSTGVNMDMAETATAIYNTYSAMGNNTKDFSGIINLIRDSSVPPG